MDKLTNEQLMSEIQKLRNEFTQLSQQYYKNNFSISQVFNKDSVFNTRLRVPVYSSAPTVSEVGDVICIGGKLWICTVANSTWELVGTQS